MPTIVTASELVRRAFAYVAEQRRDHPEIPLDSLLDTAGMRFNLTPLDSAALLRLFRESPEETPRS